MRSKVRNLDGSFGGDLDLIFLLYIIILLFLFIISFYFFSRKDEHLHQESVSIYRLTHHASPFQDSMMLWAIYSYIDALGIFLFFQSENAGLFLFSPCIY